MQQGLGIALMHGWRHVTYKFRGRNADFSVEGIFQWNFRWKSAIAFRNDTARRTGTRRRSTCPIGLKLLWDFGVGLVDSLKQV